MSDDPDWVPYPGLNYEYLNTVLLALNLLLWTYYVAGDDLVTAL